MMGRGVRRHPKATLPGVGEESDAPLRRHVSDVEAASGQPGQREVPGDDDGLGRTRNTGQPEQRGVVALVHLPSLREGGILSMLRDHHFECRGVFQGQAHHPR